MMSDIKFLKNIVDDSYSDDWIINKFIVFESINSIFFLIYTNELKSIISYDIINNKRINEVKNAHKNFISNFRYHLDEINNRDLILSLSPDDNNIKIWNINSMDCLLDIKNIYSSGYLISASFLKDNNQILITVSNSEADKNEDLEGIQILDFKGRKIKKIKNSNEDTRFVDSYYDKLLSKNFILVCCKKYSKIYDYIKNELFHKYSDNGEPCELLANQKDEMTELFESSYDGIIRIWSFYSALLKKKIKIFNNALSQICLWDNDYLFIACDDAKIRLVDYNKGEIIHKLCEHKDIVISIKKIVHPHYGKCLLSQAANENCIKLWIIKNNYVN